MAKKDKVKLPSRVQELKDLIQEAFLDGGGCVDGPDWDWNSKDFDRVSEQLARDILAKQTREWPLQGRVWQRGDEWVLEIQGVLGDTHLTCRHTEPLTTPYEDVPGLPSLYPQTNEGDELLAEESRRDGRSTWLSW